MSDSGENTGLDLDYDDEEAFMNSFLNHVEERLNSGETDIPVNLAGIVSLPGPYIEALEAAVLAAEGAGARLWFFCTPEFSALLDQLGKSRAVPHEMIEPEVVDVPLDERRSAFELLDDWLIAREPDERDMLRQFQDNLVLMFDECAKIQLDLRKMPYLSQQLCKTLVLTAIQANEQGKPIRLKLTASQQKTLMKVPGSEFFEMPRETRRANTQQVRNLHTASQKLKRLAATAHEKSSSQSADERRECIRLRVNNAFILYKLESSSNKLKTRVVDLSESGLAFYASEPIDADTTLAIYLETPAFMQPPKVPGTVVRCEPVELKSGVSAFRIGVRFGRVTEDVGTGLRNTLGQKN